MFPVSTPHEYSLLLPLSSSENDNRRIAWLLKIVGRCTASVVVVDGARSSCISRTGDGSGVGGETAAALGWVVVVVVRETAVIGGWLVAYGCRPNKMKSFIKNF